LFAIVVLVCAAADASYMWDQPEAHYVTETAAFGKIMAIKQQSDIHFGAVHLNNLLGDTSELPKPVQKQAEDNARIEGLMVQVDQHLAKQNELLAMSADENSLGEANQLGAEESAKFAKILVRDPRKVAETIHNVVSYMGHLVKGGQALTEEQMDDARKWYIDTTALVLGRYAYDDTKADMKGQGMAFDALKSRAEAAEHRMDTVDAARHLHKMQADDMIDSKNMNIVDMLSKTGNLASFLSEIEAAEIRKRPTAAYVKQEQETLQQMEMHEGEITAAIDELMKKVELGDAITGKAMHFQHPSSTKQRLKNELMDAASKEDSARIVQAAGKVAEKKITDELNFMKTMPPKQPKYEEPPEHKGSRGTPPREVGGPTPLRSNEDLKAPVGMLARSVSSSINGQLDGILELFNKRKAHHKSLSVKEHQTVNSQLRSITANLMQKYSLLSEAQQKPAEEPREEQEPKVDPADRVAQKAKTARLLAKSFGMPLAKAHFANALLMCGIVMSVTPKSNPPAHEGSLDSPAQCRAPDHSASREKRALGPAAGEVLWHASCQGPLCPQEERECCQRWHGPLQQAQATTRTPRWRHNGWACSNDEDATGSSDEVPEDRSSSCSTSGESSTCPEGGQAGTETNNTEGEEGSSEGASHLVS
jgi:hypothetical protein